MARFHRTNRYRGLPVVQDYRTSYNFLCSRVAEYESLLASIKNDGDTFRIESVKIALKSAKKKVKDYDAKHPVVG